MPSECKLEQELELEQGLGGAGVEAGAHCGAAKVEENSEKKSITLKPAIVKDKAAENTYNEYEHSVRVTNMILEAAISKKSMSR